MKTVPEGGCSPVGTFELGFLPIQIEQAQSFCDKYPPRHHDINAYAKMESDLLALFMLGEKMISLKGINMSFDMEST